MHVQVIRVGRKRKQGVERFACGKINFESPESVLAVGINQRVKQGIPFELAVVRDERTGKIVRANQDSGHVLGRLKQLGQINGGISMRQHDAGMDYARLVRQYAALKGIPLGSPKSPAFELVSTGISLRPEPDQDVIDRCIGRYNDCQHMLADEGRTHGNRLQKVVHGICLERMSWDDLQAEPDGVALLRLGLNAVGRVLR